MTFGCVPNVFKTRLAKSSSTIMNKSLLDPESIAVRESFEVLYEIQFTV